MEECRTVTEKGQVTIPEAIRTELGLRSGDRLIFSYAGEETVMVKKDKTKTPRTAGLLDKYLKTKAKGVSVTEMNEAIKAGAEKGFRS